MCGRIQQAQRSCGGHGMGSAEPALGAQRPFVRSWASIWSATRWVIVVALAMYWSIRPTALPTAVLYGTHDTQKLSPAAIYAHSAADSSNAPLVTADSAVRSVDWRMLGMLDYRSGIVPPNIERLNGQRVRIPGFIVPLDDFADKAKEFLLVPYYGACVHMPPPPPNQMVLVKLTGGPKAMALFAPVWIEGILVIKRVESPYGAVSYQMFGERIIPYQSP